MTLNGIGFAYTRLGEYAQALNYYERSLAIRRETGDRRGEGIVLNSIGFIYFRLGEYVQALDYYKQSLAIREEIGDRRGKGVTLSYIGQVYYSLGNHIQALTYYERSLVIRNEIGDRAGEAIALSQIGEAFISQGQPKLAVIFLKRSVNEYEKIRDSLADVDNSLHSSYTDSIAETYRKLADLLLQQDRVLEAQHVLDLLKVQELDDYLQNVRGDARTASGIEYYRPEQAILNRYNDLQASAIEIGQQLAALNRKDRESGSLTENELAQRNQLYQLDKEIRQQFNDFADDPAIRTYVDQITQANGTLLIEEIAGLTDKLSDVNAVLIYPLVLDDRIELIITTPNSAPLRRTVKNISRQELNSAIAAFRAALSNPYGDVKTPAQGLYRWLIEPLEQDLADAQQKTILYAPDGPLRYVPLAALYDGDDEGQWLAERFQINNITTTSLQEIATQPATTPRTLAGAFADKNITHSVEMGNRVATFQGLPFAGIEVATLANTLTNISTYLDQDFSLNTLEPQLNNFNILHFATHASLVPGDAEESFILFGDGESPTIRDIASWNLNNVDLVVLSACETGLGGFDNNGEQILGLGYQFQQIGARAVIASLWQVDDGGTQALMNAFYLALRNGFSKTEALQRSQRALIKNDLSFVGEHQGKIQTINAAGGQPVTLKGALDHPYYWAPFILIGNGL